MIERHFADCREIPSHWAIRRVLTAFEARARFGGETSSGFIRQLMVTGHNGWLLAYDNISVIADVVSDGLCMVSTGGVPADAARG